MLGGVVGTVAGSASALVNALYFIGFCSLTGSFSYPTSLTSVALSSLFFCFWVSSGAVADRARSRRLTRAR